MFQRKSWLYAAALFVMPALLAGCEDQNAGPAAAGPAATDDSGGGKESLIQRIDKHGDEIMAADKKAEARQWLKDPNHGFFKANRDQVAKFIEDFYSAGADQVIIGDMETLEGKELAGALLVVLPKDAAARAKLFEIGKRAGDLYQEDPVGDQGQKYLYFSPE
jgi:hypothetical protein